MELKNKTKFLLVFGIIFVSFLLFNTNKVSAAEISDYKYKAEGEGYILYNDFYSSNNCIKEDSYGITLYKANQLDSEINKMIEDTNNKKTSKLLIEIANNITSATANNDGVTQNLEIINLNDKKYAVVEVEYHIGTNDTNKITRYASVNIHLHSSNDNSLGGGEHKYFTINEMLYKKYPKIIIDNYPYDFSYIDATIDDSITLGEPILKEKIEGITLSRTIEEGYGENDINYNVNVDKEIFKKNYESGYYDKYIDEYGNITIPVYVEIPNNVAWVVQGTGVHFASLETEQINGKNYFKYDATIRWSSMSFEEDFSCPVYDDQAVDFLFEIDYGAIGRWKRRSNCIVFNRIIVKNEAITDVTIKNEDTDIKLDTDISVVPSNTILNAIKIKTEKILNTIKESLKEISNKYTSYDINLLSDGAKIQPNGKVKISIPIPSDYDKSKLAVYRIADDGTRTKYDVTVNGEYATFETDHFSTYVLAENNKVVDNEENNTNKGEKDNTPKTGTIDIISYVLGVTLLSGAGIVTLKKKLN